MQYVFLVDRMATRCDVMRMANLKTISVRLTERQRQALADIAASQEREQSFLIRKAVDGLIAGWAKRNKQRKNQTPAA